MVHQGVAEGDDGPEQWPQAKGKAHFREGDVGRKEVELHKEQGLRKIAEIEEIIVPPLRTVVNPPGKEKERWGTVGSGLDEKHGW